MKLHVEYDDFGEYVEAVIDGELVPVKDCESDRRSVELIHQEFPTHSRKSGTRQGSNWVPLPSRIISLAFSTENAFL